MLHVLAHNPTLIPNPYIKPILITSKIIFFLQYLNHNHNTLIV